MDHLLERDPGNLRILESLRQLAADFSLWPEAERLQRRIIGANPRAVAGDYAILGQILLRAGDWQHAAEALEQCLVRDPYNYQGHRNLSELWRAQKNWSEARRHLEFIRRYFPDADAETYMLLIEADKALGDKRAA